MAMTNAGRPLPPRKKAAPEGGAPGTPTPKKRRKTLPKEGRPTADDIMVTLPMLKERDKELLAWLYVHRYATTDQIHWRFWARDNGSPAKVLQDCRRRLWELGAAGMIAGVPYQQRSRAWCLDRKGLQAAQTLMRISKESWISPDEWSLGSSSFLHHYVETTEIACLVEAHMIPWVVTVPHFGRLDNAFRWRSRTRLLWKLGDDRKASAQYLYDDGRVMLRNVREDGHGRTVLDDWTEVFLEVDLDTEPEWELEEKLDRYGAGFELADHAETPYPDMAPREHQRYILFACSSPERATKVQAMIGRRFLPGIAVTLDEAPNALLQIESRVEAHLNPLLEAEEQRRRQAEEERQRREEERERERRQQGLHLSKHDRYMNWNRYDVALSHYQLAEDEYVKKHKIPFLKPEAQCRAEFQAQNKAPQPPTYPRPDHWY